MDVGNDFFEIGRKLDSADATIEEEIEMLSNFYNALPEPKTDV